MTHAHVEDGETNTYNVTESQKPNLHLKSLAGYKCIQDAEE